MDEPVLYRRAKQSDIIQGMLDTIELLDLEYQKLYRFYPTNILANYGGSGTLYDGIQMLRNQIWVLREPLQQLRERGL